MLMLFVSQTIINKLSYTHKMVVMTSIGKFINLMVLGTTTMMTLWSSVFLTI